GARRGGQRRRRRPSRRGRGRRRGGGERGDPDRGRGRTRACGWRALARERDRRMSALVSRDDVAAAAAALRDIAVRTPLVRAPWLEDAAGAEVRLKCENLQRAGAFKVRGAYTMIARLPEAERRRGVITYSSGNHAQAVALAARHFG